MIRVANALVEAPAWAGGSGEATLQAEEVEMAVSGVSKDVSMDNLVDNRNGTIKPALLSHPDIYERELEQIFARMWLFVGHESQIPTPGDYVRSRMGEG